MDLCRRSTERICKPWGILSLRWFSLVSCSLLRRKESWNHLSTHVKISNTFSTQYRDTVTRPCGYWGASSWQSFSFRRRRKKFNLVQVQELLIQLHCSLAAQFASPRPLASAKCPPRGRTFKNDAQNQPHLSCLGSSTATWASCCSFWELCWLSTSSIMRFGQILELSQNFHSLVSLPT